MRAPVTTFFRWPGVFGCPVTAGDRCHSFKTLRLFRDILGISQQRLEAVSGVPASQISMIETGRLQPTEMQLQRLAKIFGVASDVLMNEITSDDLSVLVKAKAEQQTEAVAR